MMISGRLVAMGLNWGGGRHKTKAKRVDMGKSSQLVDMGMAMSSQLGKMQMQQILVAAIWQ